MHKMNHLIFGTASGRNRFSLLFLLVLTSLVSSTYPLLALTGNQPDSGTSVNPVPDSLSIPKTGSTPPTATLLNQAALIRLLNDSFVNVFEKVSPSVVVISVSKKTIAEDGEGGADYFQDFFFPNGKRAPQAVLSEGSGFLVRSDGYIFTNFHVINEAEKITVRLRDGREFPGRIIGTDERTDIAVLKIDGTNFPCAELADSDAVRVGQIACAIGAPYNLDYTFTVGWISAKGRNNLQNGDQHVMYEEYLQTDASINPGNSGGPLLDMDGRVVGMNTLINGINRGLGFAIPINIVNEVGNTLIANGRITRPWIGVRIESLSDSKDFRNTPNTKGASKGVVVVSIEPDTPAFKSELRPADLITAVDGEPVGSDRDLQKKILTKKIGQTVHLTVRRQNRTLNIPVVTGELPIDPVKPATKRTNPKTSESSPTNLSDSLFGLKVQLLTPELSTRLGVNVTQGVVVTEVKDGSIAALAKVMREDVITEVDNKPISTVRDFQESLKNSDSNRGALLFIHRRGEKTFAVLKETE